MFNRVLCNNINPLGDYTVENSLYGTGSKASSRSHQDNNEHVVIIPNPAYQAHTTSNRFHAEREDPNDVDDEYVSMHPVNQYSPHHNDIKMDTNPSYGVAAHRK